MAVTLGYLAPTTAGATTAPTLAQMTKLNEVACTVIKSADGDTTATITHNMALTAAQLAAGYPEVYLEPMLLKFYTINPFVASKTANTVVITMATTGGGGDAAIQFLARIIRPTSKTK